MSVGLLVFSRFDSRRLPGKALREIAGRPLLGHVLDRVREVRGADRVVVATSDRRVDDAIADFAATEGVAVFRGAADDVLGRAVDCARTFRLDNVVRICGDSPFIDPGLIDGLITIHVEEHPDITTNLWPRTFPPGMSVEVIAAAALERASELATEPRQREHVTPVFYENPASFRIRNVVSGVDGWEDVPLTVDTAQDLAQARWILEASRGKGDRWDMRSIVSLAGRWQSERPAALGGRPTVAEPLKPYPSMGEAEVRAVREVVRSGCLSGFYGSPGPEFLGGPKVKAFEKAWAQRFGVAHAVSMNSATSGLLAAIGAVGISPGDEVIVPPWTMSATAVTPLFYGGIPVFADIEDTTFGLDPAAVEAAITLKTRAIVAVNLFGHPARLSELRAIADRHGLKLVEDNAQAPLGMDNGRPCGTIGHIGVFSLNFHKHIHTGEGGVCVTGDDELAKRLQLIRNHGENSAAAMGFSDPANLVGLNFRMTELSAAIGIEQLAGADEHVARRERLAQGLSDGTRDLAGWTVPAVREGCRHNYYEWVVRYDAAAVGLSRAAFSKALEKEGFPHFTGYVAPLYRLPIFRQRRAIGRDGYPFTLTNRTYEDGLCPVAERLHAEEAILFEPCAYEVDEATLDRLIAAIRKVHAHREELRVLDETPAA